MDDRDLEARLRARLHDRFDAAEPSLELRAGIEQVFRTRPRPVGLADMLFRRRPAWGAVAALALVAAVAFAAGSIGRWPGPGDQATPTPDASFGASNERWFMALPGFEASPTRAESEAVTDILAGRLQALGVRDIVTTTRTGIAFHVAHGGPSDDDIRSVLGAVGDVQLVPLPVKDYGQLGDGRVRAVVGEPLPTNPTGLFGWEGIASIERPENEGQGDAGDVLITLTPAARQVFAEWTAAHVNETIAIVVDGEVAALPTINEAVPSGQVTVSAGGSESPAVDRYLAILLGGRVPDSWGSPTSPAIVPVDLVIAATQREDPGANPLLWTLDTQQDGGLWIPVWQVTFGGEFTAACTPPPASQPPCLIYSRLVVTADASNGVPIEVEYGN